MPRLRDKEELLEEVKVKASWRDAGSQGTYFQPPPIMKPKMLDPWTMDRVQKPERAYEKYFFKDEPPFGYTPSHGRLFGKPSENSHPEHFREFLKKREKDFIEWTECPSKFETPRSVPRAFDRINKA